MAEITQRTALVSVLLAIGMAGVLVYVSRPFDDEVLSSGDRSQVSIAGKAAVKGARTAHLVIIPGQKKVSATTSYTSPAGSENIGFSLLVNADGTIEDAMVDVLATNDISKKRQEAFGDALVDAIKGKNLKNIEALDSIGGSLLTTNAFNSVLENLKSQL